MCKMRVVVNREMLGNREICWSLWSGKDVMEMTSSQIKNLLKAGHEVKGLTTGEDGELVPDKEGFFCNNIMEHRHCGNYVPMAECENMVNVFYIVTGSHEENGKAVYDCISTKYEQTVILEEDLKVYLKLGIISAGARLEGDKVFLPGEKKAVEVKKAKPVMKEKKAEEKIETEKQEKSNR